MKRVAAVVVAMALAGAAGGVVGVTGGWSPVVSPAYAMTDQLPPGVPPPSPTPTPAPTTTPAPAPAPARPVCPTVSTPFTPRTITVPGVTSQSRVVMPPRVTRRVPGAPPLTAAGKREFAYDVKQGIQPGDRRGNVLLNAHVWPDGSALGNRLLSHLHRGDRIVVKGTHRMLCYRVTERVQVLASHGLRRYYSKRGTPKLALVVCSGRRLAPGVWQKRTVWFAAPRA